MSPCGDLPSAKQATHALSLASPLRYLPTAIEKPPFEVTETGWGEFDIIIKIFFVAEAAEKPLTFTHHLKLHPWPLDLSTLPPPPDPNAPPTDPPTPAEPPAVVLSPVHSWQYEEIVFAEPTETFYATLLARPPAPLPRANRHPKTLVHALGGGGNFGEFSLEMEKEEGERMEEARRKALEEVEVMRKQLVEHEKELTGALASETPRRRVADSLSSCRSQEGSRGDSDDTGGGGGIGGIRSGVGTLCTNTTLNPAVQSRALSSLSLSRALLTLASLLGANHSLPPTSPTADAPTPSSNYLPLAFSPRSPFDRSSLTFRLSRHRAPSGRA